MTAALAPQDPDPALGRKVVVSTTTQLAAKVLHLAFNVVSTLAIVRYLAPSEYGVYVLVLTVTAVVGLVADFGLPKVAVRDITGSGADENEVVGTIVALRLALAVGGLAVTELVLLAMGQPGRALLAAAVASLVFLSEAVLAALVVCFQVRLVQQVEALIRTGTEALETAAILVLVALNAGLVWLFVPPVAGTALGAALAFAVARGRYAVRPRFAPARAGGLLREALPIAPALLISMLYRKLDGLSLAVFRPSREVGLYGSAAQPVEYYFLTTALFMNVMFPLLSRAYGHGEQATFRRLYRRGAEVLVAVTLIVPVALLFTAGGLVRQVYGADYAGAATPLLLLSVAMVLLVVAVWQSLALLVAGHQRVTVSYNAAALLVAAVLCVLLVRDLGLLGAGLTAVGTAAFVAAASALTVRRRLGVWPDARGLARVLAAGGVTCAVTGVLAAAVTLPWSVLAAVAIAVYGVALFGLRVPGAFREVLA